MFAKECQNGMDSNENFHFARANLRCNKLPPETPPILSGIAKVLAEL